MRKLTTKNSGIANALDRYETAEVNAKVAASMPLRLGFLITKYRVGLEIERLWHHQTEQTLLALQSLGLSDLVITELVAQQARKMRLSVSRVLTSLVRYDKAVNNAAESYESEKEQQYLITAFRYAHATYLKWQRQVAATAEELKAVGMPVREINQLRRNQRLLGVAL